MILDIHSHHPAPDSEAVISVTPEEFRPVAGQIYSIGIHPWDLNGMTDGHMDSLEEYASRTDIVAIGETGFDMTHGNYAPLFRQINVFRLHVALSERLGKPLVIHDVKMHDIVLGLHKELAPSQPWIIHGFRNKPSVLRMLDRPGIFFSFGVRFNTDSLRLCPDDRLLAETDDSPEPIREVIDILSAARGEDLTQLIHNNTSRVLKSLPPII